jgi:Protein of unknown function (DUF3592)
MNSEKLTRLRILVWTASGVLVVFLGLCTLFVLVVTLAQAWQERAQSHWPQETARIEKCDLSQSSTGRRQSYTIRCRLSYQIGFEQDSATIYSGYAPSRAVWQYPPNQIAPLETWVDAHPPGTPIVIRYDPNNHKRVLLASDYIPSGGPKTPKNIKLLTAVAASLLVGWIVVRLTKPPASTLQQYFPATQNR